MTRAKTKEELCLNTNANYNKLVMLLSELTGDELSSDFSFETLNKKEAHWKRDKNIRDVVAHLVAWQELLINFIVQNKKGVPTKFLPKDYNWKNYQLLNEEIWFNCQNVELSYLLEQLFKNNNTMLSLIEKFSEEELFTKKYFSWTGSTHLASYIISSGSSHYIWAINKINLHKKTCRNNLK